MSTTIRCANSNVSANASRLNRTNLFIQGYGALSSDPDGQPLYFGHLPSRLRDILINRRKHIGRVIYSYSTPIAWFDKEYDRWVVPSVKYSATTGKHQSSLYCLPNAAYIMWDTPLDEYFRVMDYKMVYAYGRTLPY